jgi:hypothetical protein
MLMRPLKPIMGGDIVKVVYYIVECSINHGLGIMHLIQILECGIGPHIWCIALYFHSIQASHLN